MKGGGGGRSCPAQRYPSIRRTVDPPPSSNLPPSYILYPGEDSPRPSPPSPTGSSYEGEAARENE